MSAEQPSNASTAADDQPTIGQRIGQTIDSTLGTNKTATNGSASAPSDAPNTDETKAAGKNAGAGSDRAANASTDSEDTGADPSSAQKPEQKQQGADRPTDEPEEGGDSKPQPMGGAGGAGGPALPESKGTGEGTGLKVEHASDVAAEGGDFDASKPGAGQEATRLLEEKGIKGADKSSSKAEPASKKAKTEHDGKSGGVSKLKEKLHT